MHPDDDMAKQIRNEQMRDAMPTREEAEADHRRHLASEGCRHCDESNPEKLVEMNEYVHDCPAHQAQADGSSYIICYNCYDYHADGLNPEADHRRRIKKSAARSDDRLGVVFFTCGVHEWIDRPVLTEIETGEEAYADEVDYYEAEMYYEGEARPQIAPWCRCGADIDEVSRADLR